MISYNEDLAPHYIRNYRLYIAIQYISRNNIFLFKIFHRPINIYKYLLNIVGCYKNKKMFHKLLRID